MSSAQQRRRMLALAAVGLVLLVAAIAAISSGSSTPHYVPAAGGGLATVLTPKPPSSAKTEIKRPPSFHPASATIALASKLPLASQIAQLFLVTVDGKGVGAPGGLGTTDWGGVVLDSSNFQSDAQLKGLTGEIVKSARATGRTPPLLAATQEGGPQTAFRDLPPQAEPTIGASGQPAIAAQQALAAGKRLKALGLAMTLAPLADVDTPGGALSGRLFSSDPEAVANFTVAALRGYATAGLIAAVGHFPGAGGASADPDQLPATVGGSLAQLQARDLIPFAAVTTSAPVMLMSNASYAAFDGVTPASLSPQAIALLRHTYGYAGVIMSDDLDATLQPTGQDAGSVAVEALKAGDDLLYISGPPSEHLQAYEGVLAAAQRNASLRAQVRDALLHDLSLKVRYGLLR